MDEGLAKLRITTILLLSGVLIASLTNTCAVSKLEEQVIRNRKLIERGGGGGGGITPSAATERIPGQPTGFNAVGWGGRRAPITFVQDAAQDGVLRLQDKPRPQGDWEVNRTTAMPSTLNQFTTSEGTPRTISNYSLDGLLASDYAHPDVVVPSLAVDWEVSKDKLTYIFRLRKGVQFADGRPFTSADVLFSYQVIQDPDVKAEHLRSSFDSVEEMTAPDPYTVMVKYKRKHWKGLFVVGTTLRILNRAWFEEEIPKYAAKFEIARFATTPGQPGFAEVFNKIRIPCPGTGPYYVRSDEDFDKERVILVQNPFYFGIQVWPERWNLKQLRWRIISDDAAAKEAFRKGEIDVQVVDHDSWEEDLSKDETIARIADCLSYDFYALDCSYIAWNCRRPPFDDPRVRTAMTYLTNRQWILDEIERGNGTIAVCKSKRNYATYSNDLEPHAYDIEKARTLLAEAGWTDTDGDGILDKDGKKFEWVFKIPNVRTFFRIVSGQLKDACKQVGIRMDERPLEWATFIRDLNARDFDAVCLYNSFSDPWIDLYEEGWHSAHDVPNGNNITGWRNPEVDELTRGMQEEFDEEKRTTMFHRFNRIFYDEQPMTLLVHGQVRVLVNKRFEEIKVWPRGLTSFEWWVRPEKVLYK
jgi:peptide/nickel transport system substrate-binding protein